MKTLILRTFLYSRSLDYIQVMTYDLHDPKNGYTGENSPLYKSPFDTGKSADLNVVRH